jgi:hypothetical protein
VICLEVISFWITVENLELIHAPYNSDLTGRVHLLEQSRKAALTPDILSIVWLYARDVTSRRLAYQLLMVFPLGTMVLTGNGESGFVSGEGA